MHRMGQNELTKYEIDQDALPCTYSLKHGICCYVHQEEYDEIEFRYTKRTYS